MPFDRDERARILQRRGGILERTRENRARLLQQRGDPTRISRPVPTGHSPTGTRGGLFPDQFQGGTEHPSFFSSDRFTIGSSDVNLDMRGFDPVTREVADNELVENRLTDLLRSDSRFIENARQRGREQAIGMRGLSPTMAAEASERAALEAGLPIAMADAEAFRQAASENIQVINNNIMAKLQSATQMAMTRMSTNSAQKIAALQANSAESIAQWRIQAEQAMQLLAFDHDFGMEGLRQEGREALVDLAHRNGIELEEMFGNPRFFAQLELNRTQVMSGFALSIMSQFAQGISDMNGLDIDEAAAQRGFNFWGNYLQNGFGFLQRLFGSDFPDIVFTQGG